MTSNGAHRPLITAGVTAYNAAETIERAVDSALVQTWEPLEILIVDDGSTDGTRDILARLEADHPQIRVILHDTNQGTAVARNTLIEHAHGDAIAFFDDDDISHPERVARQWHRLATFEATVAEGAQTLALCHTGRRERFEDGRQVVRPAMGSNQERPGPNGYRLVGHLLWGRRLARTDRGATGTGSQIGRISTYQRLKGFDTRFRRMQDRELNVRIARSGGYLLGVRAPLIVRDVKPSSDRNAEVQEHAEGLLLTTHRDAFPSAAAFRSMQRWSQARFALRRGNTPRALLHVASSLLLDPVRASYRILDYVVTARKNVLSRQGMRRVVRLAGSQKPAQIPPDAPSP